MNNTDLQLRYKKVVHEFKVILHYFLDNESQMVLSVINGATLLMFSDKTKRLT